MASDLIPWSGINARYLQPSGSDDSAVVDAALAQGGTVVLGPGIWHWWQTVPAFRPGIPATIQGWHVGATFVQASLAGPRLVDFGKTADYQTFTDCEVLDLTFDCNNVGGQHHVVLGTYAAGLQLSKINLARIAARRVRTLNVPTDPTAVNHRLNVWLYVEVLATDSPCTMTDITIEDFDFSHGGNIGIGIGGTASTGSTAGNLTHDRIVVQRGVHDTRASPAQLAAGTWSSYSVQIGSRDTGLNISVRDVNSFNVGDVGIAMLNSRYGQCEDCTATDARNLHFQAINLNPNLPGDQQHTFRSCHAKLAQLNPINGGSYAAQGFGNAGPGGQQMGNMTLADCSWQGAPVNGNVPPPGSAIMISNPLRSFNIVGEFRMNAPAVNHSLAANYAGGLVVFNPPGGATFNGRGALRSNVQGTVTLNGHTFAFNEVSIVGQASSAYVLDVDAHYVNYGLAGVPANSYIGCLIGPSTVLAPLPTFKGQYRMLIESHTSADTGPRGILTQPAYSAAPQIQIAGILRFPNCDFAAFPVGSVGQEIVIDGAAQTFADVSLAGSVATVLIFYPGIVPANGGVMPQPAGFGIGALTGNIINLAGVRRKIFFTGNMPTAVTFQRRSNTTPVAIAVATQAAYELEPGDRLNLTFAGTTGNTYDRIPAVL